MPSDTSTRFCFATATFAVVIFEPPLDDRYEATVAVIDKIMDAASSSFGVQLLLENPDLKVPAGLRCTLEIDL
ncbi:MAG: hypothetical protein U5O39_07265 [Gammaproteobacteria bacterium]|nr:hypothetical protein [Gammaproteobacteria bacterium]